MQDEATRRAVNTEIREFTIKNILAAILWDMRVYKIEGWDFREFPERLKREIDAIVNKFDKENNARK